MKRIVVVGGGIAGLSIAFALRKKAPAVQLLLFERGLRPGGNIRTEQVDGYLCEAGPNGFLDNAPDTLRLIRDLRLESRVLPSSDAARHRFIVRGERLREVPSSPQSLLTTRAVSASAKLRIAMEPFARRRTDDDECVFDFAARRIGQEAAETLVGPMISGMFAGDPRALSLAACFPRMRQMEDRYGSLVRALMAKRRATAANATGAPAGRLTSFESGMSELIEALAAALNGSVRTSTTVRMLWPQTGVSPQSEYVVAASTGAVQADAVVLAGPAAESAVLVRGFDPALADLLDGIPSAPLAVVCLGFPAAAIQKTCSLNGYGFLVPRREPFRILGASWESSIYRNRAPDGKALLRVMVGGALDHGAVSLTDTELLQIVTRDLGGIMGIVDKPDFVRIIRHRRGIPQYVRGHLARMREIDARLRCRPGVFLAGNSYRALSMNGCIAEANGVVDGVLAHINRPQPALTPA
jgi:oxygen-dependent protoporphyrinogen oxidase